MQEASYFALRLPHGWWLLGLDLALVDDIDMCQCRYARWAAVQYKAILVFSSHDYCKFVIRGSQQCSSMPTCLLVLAVFAVFFSNDEPADLMLV